MADATRIAARPGRGPRRRPPVALLAVCLAGSITLLGQDAGEVLTSSVDLGGVTMRVTHELSGDANPSLPDLSRPQKRSIPRRAVLEVPRPLVFDGCVLETAEYELTLVVDEDAELFLEFQSLDGGDGGRCRLNRADYSAPGTGLQVSLSYVRKQEQGGSGRLMIRWGSLLVEAAFAPLTQRSLTAGDVRIETFEFPPEFQQLSSQLPLGSLTQGDGTAQWLSLQSDGAKESLTGMRIRIEPRNYRNTVMRKSGLLRELQQVETSTELTDEERANKVRSLEARIRQLDRVLGSAEGSIREIRGTIGDANRAVARVEVTLAESAEGLHLEVYLPPNQKVRFPLKDL